MRRSNAGMGQEEEENEINLTPMLDVVFIMLIFFIVTASFIKEAGIDVNRPDAPTSQAVEDANILIAISSNDEIWIDRRLIDPRAVRANIEGCTRKTRKGLWSSRRTRSPPMKCLWWLWMHRGQRVYSMYRLRPTTSWNQELDAIF